MHLEEWFASGRTAVYALARSKRWLKVKTASSRAQMQKRIGDLGEMNPQLPARAA